MTTPEQPSHMEIQSKLRELLGRATLARTRRQWEQALKLVQEAIALDESSAEAHELQGDLLLELKRGAEAMGSFRRARELRPSRALLEDKIARAALQQAARQQRIELSQAILEGRVKPASKRSPGYAAVLSLMLPGLGQFYNGEVVKGLVMLTAYVFLLALALLAVLREIATSPSAAGGGLFGQEINVGAIFSGLSSGGTTLVSVLLVVLWLYGIGDAAWRASKTLTSDETGLV